MTSNWSTMPMVTCPHCGKEFQLHDYWDYEVDDTFDCYMCEREIHIISKNVAIEVELSIAPF